MKGATTFDGANIGLKIEPLVGGQDVDANISRLSSDEWPVQFFTSTTDMRDWIGNVTKIEDGKCSVEGVYRRRWTKMRNIRVCDAAIVKEGDRVMITEHMNIDGKMGFIATKRRVLVENKGSAINYANVGWSDDKRCRYLRFDVYTGEYKIFECRPVYMFYKK